MAEGANGVASGEVPASEPKHKATYETVDELGEALGVDGVAFGKRVLEMMVHL